MNLISEPTAEDASSHVSSLQHSIRFPRPALTDHAWPVIEVLAPSTGPHVCIMAGMHVNEVCGIEAAFRLARALPDILARGRVSIMPFVNTPALAARTEHNCPVDGKNINWQFPGNPEGSFSEQLADALLNVWAADADVLIDFHGGDLREEIASFVMYQETPDPALNAANRRLAECFDVAFVEPLRPALMDKGGRACTGRGRQDRLAVMSEAGSSGQLDEACVVIHYAGTLRILASMGMLAVEPPVASRKPAGVRDRTGVEAPVTGFMRTCVSVGDRVQQGQKVADIRDLHGQVVRDIEAPITGTMLFKLSHPLVNQGERAMSFVYNRDD